MFTGLIEQIGTIMDVMKDTISVKTSYRDLKIGESIAVDGVCLTVEKSRSSAFFAHIAEETLKKTIFFLYKAGTRVNIERALLPTDRLGGHIIQGHVDGTGDITALVKKEQSWILTITAPESLIKYIAPKGSIAVDGISLTVAGIRGRNVDIAVIPHTYAHTALQHKGIGDHVNIETDIIAKYLERLMKHTDMDTLYQSKQITMESLMNGGFK